MTSGPDMTSRLIPELLRDVALRRYWSASTITMFGDQISVIALPLAAVLTLHAGAAQMGYLTALEWVPSLLWPLAHGPLLLVLAMLLAAEFGSGFGMIMLDINIGAIFATVIPAQLRSRVNGAF